jgi:hypothetical protein
VRTGPRRTSCSRAWHPGSPRCATARTSPRDPNGQVAADRDGAGGQSHDSTAILRTSSSGCSRMP